MDAIGERARLERPPQEAPWLPADLAARFALYRWPGNVRQLANVVRQVVIAGRGSDQAQIPLELEALWRPEAKPRPTPTATRAPAAAEISDEELMNVLRASRFSTVEAARALGISRTTLYALIDRSPSIRKARDIGADELRACLRECDGSVPLAAERLSVSDRALKLRMKELGLDA
jgi:two-component system nitrogen regulation response regulator GlnG